MATANAVPSLIVHGGAWTIPESAIEDAKSGCRRALEAGWGVLSSGGPALDAVEAAIVVLEDDSIFDAGVGSHLNREGEVELDAIVMDGGTLAAGAVASVRCVRNPIRLARKVMESTEHVLLVGAGAEQFAVEHGLPLCKPEDLIIERERKAWQKCRQGKHSSAHHFAEHHGTVGAVARDRGGNIVAGTSTGGTCCKLPGRVGDSPLIGCGCYADVEAGGISCTGWGEAIMRIVMAKTAADFLRPPTDGAALSADQAAARTVRLLAERGKGTGGLILLDREGRPGFAFNTPHMAYGYVAADGTLVVAV
jgi:beta-aspartyl-peptidase (threonine type)